MAKRTKDEIIQFIRGCYIPNNTSYSLSDLPSGWEDYIDGNISLDENIEKVMKLLHMNDKNEDKRLMSKINHKNYYEYYQYLKNKHYDTE